MNLLEKPLIDQQKLKMITDSASDLSQSYNKTLIHQQNSTTHGITKTKKNKNHGEKQLQRN